MGIDAELSKHALHAEGAGFVRHDGHDELADVGVAGEGGERAHEGHGGGHFPLAAALEEQIEYLQRGDLQRGYARTAEGQVAAETFPFLTQVDHLDAVFFGAEERGLGDLVVGNRNVEPVPKGLE